MNDSGMEILGFFHPKGYLPYRGGTVVIYGENGAGKSLLLESIESSLTGLPAGRSPRNSLGNLDRLNSAVIVGAKFTGLGVNYGEVRTLSGDREMASAIHSALEAGIDGWPTVASHTWEAIVTTLGEGAYSLLAPSGNTDARWHAFATIAPDSALLERWNTAVHADYEAGREEGQSFEEWVESDDTICAYDELSEHVNSQPGFLAEGGHLYFNAYTRVLERSEFGRVVTETTIDLAGMVRGWVAKALDQEEQPTPDGRWVRAALAPDEIAARLSPTSAAWTERTNQLLQQFLLDPPLLRLALGTTTDWVSSEPPRWETAGGVTIDQLSDAEKRWSRIAIALAAPEEWSVMGATTEAEAHFPIDEDSEEPAPFLILDEPERGLHRAAERHMAAGLLSIAATGRIRPILATHSPVLLDAGEGQVFEIKKSGGGIGHVSELMPNEIAELSTFDLQPSSLLDRDRGYLLVEGVHDKHILEGWFSEELRSLRVSVLAMHGTSNLLTVFDSEFLLERSDALLMPLLDDVALDPLFDLWAETEAKVAEGRPSDAFNLIRRGMDGIRGAAKDYGPLLAGTITRGVSERFFPLGMSKKDVLEYLPVAELVEGASSWGDLRRQWKSSPAAIAGGTGRGSGAAYKKWLRSRGADLSPENLRLVAETTAPHPELKAMMARISERLG